MQEKKTVQMNTTNRSRLVLSFSKKLFLWITSLWCNGVIIQRGFWSTRRMLNWKYSLCSMAVHPRSFTVATIWNFAFFNYKTKKNKQSKTEIKQNSKTKNWTQSLCPRTQDRSHGACSYSVCNEVNPANAWSSTCEILLSFNNLKK